MNLNVGDRVSYIGGMADRDAGVVTLLPGMEEYDNRGYTSPETGCVYRGDNGVDYWAHQHNLYIVKNKILWEV